MTRRLAYLFSVPMAVVLICSSLVVSASATAGATTQPGSPAQCAQAEQQQVAAQQAYNTDENNLGIIEKQATSFAEQIQDVQIQIEQDQVEIQKYGTDQSTATDKRRTKFATVDVSQTNCMT